MELLPDKGKKIHDNISYLEEHLKKLEMSDSGKTKYVVINLFMQEVY